MKLGKKEEAREALEQALTLDPAERYGREYTQTPEERVDSPRSNSCIFLILSHRWTNYTPHYRITLGGGRPHRARRASRSPGSPAEVTMVVLGRCRSLLNLRGTGAFLRR